MQRAMRTQQNGRNRRPILSLVLALLAPFLTALIGGTATGRSVSTWYPKLNKPRWTPPSWIFGPVWTTLYTAMGVASWLVWREGQENRNRKEQATGALKLYGVHLFFNALWSVLFFGLRRIGWAALEIGLLWSLIGATLLRFYRIRPLAGLLLVPYLLWSTFASALNVRFYQLNRPGRKVPFGWDR